MQKWGFSEWSHIPSQKAKIWTSHGCACPDWTASWPFIILMTLDKVDILVEVFKKFERDSQSHWMWTTYLSVVFWGYWTIAPPPYIPSPNELSIQIFGNLSHIFWPRFMCIGMKHFSENCQTNFQIATVNKIENICRHILDNSTSKRRVVKACAVHIFSMSTTPLYCKYVCKVATLQCSLYQQNAIFRCISACK